MTPRTTVSILRAASLLGVSRRTIYNYIRAGKLLTLRTLGGSQRIRMADLRADPRYEAQENRTYAGRAVFDALVAASGARRVPLLLRVKPKQTK